MTLVEMMVVVAIIALIGSVVGVAVWKQLDDAKRQVAFTQIKQIGEVLDLYRLRFHHYPSTGDGLQALVQPKGNEEPFMDSLPQDPWGNGYVYIFPAAQNPSGYDLISYGPDGVQGGSDDITNRDDPNKAVE